MSSVKFTKNKVVIEVEGSTIVIKPLIRKDLKTFFSLYEELLASCIEKNYAIGSIIAEDSNWELMTKMAKLLPIEAEEKKGLNISSIENEFEILTKLFISTSIDEETGAVKADDSNFQPGMLARLNGFDFFTVMQKQTQEKLKGQIELMQMIQQVQKG